MRRVGESTPRAISHLTPIAVASARGALITDVDGNTFIDFAGGIGVMNSGHSNPAVVEAIRKQAEDYLHVCFMVTTYEPYAQLAETLNALVPGPGPKKTALFNSGAEAVDNAIKVARFYTKRPGIVAVERSFHGRTLGALSVTGQVSPYRLGMGPLLNDIYWLPAPYEYRCDACGEELCLTHSPEYLYQLFQSQAAPETIAALIIEPVLGEGGFIVPRPEFLQELKRICDEFGILFIADEIQTGFGRTGRMFGIEHSGVTPDLTLTAKSLSGGTPLSAVTGRADVMDALPPGTLGGTYGGNPLACVAALAAIESIPRDGLVERANAIGARVQTAFEDWRSRFDIIGDVRGLGAMRAIELVTDRATRTPATEETSELVRHCYENGLIVIKAGGSGNVIRTLMPLVITDDQLDEGLAILESALMTLT